MRLQKLKQDSASLQKVKKKLFIIKKTNQKKDQSAIKQFFQTQRIQKKAFSLQKPEKKTQPAFKVQEIQISNRKTEIPQTIKQRVLSHNTPLNLNKLNIQDFIPAKKMLNKKDPFVCGLTSQKQSNQEKNREKIIYYIDFLWRISYSNGCFVKTPTQQTNYKAYIGPGNNSIMVKSILKRRFWWTLSEKSEGCHFIWSQLKQNNIFRQLQEESKTKKQKIYPFNIHKFINYLQQNSKSCESQSNSSSNKIFNSVDIAIWSDHHSKNIKTEATINERTYLKRAGLFTKKNVTQMQDSKKLIMHNHLQQNYYIGNKKALYYHMKKYYQICGMNVFDALPLTFHIIKGVDDPEYKRFLNQYEKFDSLKKNNQDQKNMWILKPGQFSNRGNGITVCHSLDDILIRLKSKQKSSDGSLRTFIIQKYIEKPLLYKSRKFDIRHYLLITCFNGCIKAYWYPQGYIRTSSSQFTLKRGSNLYVHLTNDAIQKNSQEYGKYQKGNKISYQKFQVYLDKNIRDKNCQKNIFFDKILPQMKSMTIDAVKATYLNLDQKKKEHNFQLLGMDFMIDQNYKPWLIEINTNPCLELSCPLLSRLIPSVVENTFKICVDPFFPPPQQWLTNKKNFLPDNSLQENKFELIFDESVEGYQIQKLYQGDYRLANNIGKIQQDAQIYENDGLQQWQGDSLKKED